MAAYRSGLETKVAAQITAAGLPVCYEQLPLPYVQPSKSRKYTPDFILPNGIVVETKGLFTADDRAKMALVKEQHPDLDIRLVFSNPNAKLYKNSPTTYASWCEKIGFRYAKKEVPPPWMTEPENPKSAAALRNLGWGS